MKLNQLLLILFTVISSSLYAMSGGGGPAFSDGMPGSESNCGSATLDNSSAGVNSACDPVDVSNCPPGKNAVADYGDCQYTTNGGGLCSYETCTCIGSMENNIFSQFCAPATGQFDFEIGAISCSGGAASLQFVVWSNTTSSSICDIENDIEFCDNGFTSNTTFSVNLTSGTCYTLMFDGNAGADCTWDFNINCIYALGLTMLDYSVELAKNENSVNVKWSVTEELDVNTYKIERSSDGKIFKEIGSVSAVNESKETTYYSFEDERPLIGVNYYRLKQIDNNSEVYKYGTKVVERKNINTTLFPNPINDKLNINFGKELEKGSEIEVFDILGNLVFKSVLDRKKESLTIDLSNTKKGIYFLMISTEGEKVNQKFYKE